MTDASRSALKTVFVACFAIFLALVLVYGLTLTFFVGIGGRDRFGAWIFVAMIASLFAYFRWAWFAALVSWAEFAREFHAAMPRERHSLAFVSVLCVAMIVVTHVGLLCQALLHRQARYPLR